MRSARLLACAVLAVLLAGCGMLPGTGDEEPDDVATSSPGEPATMPSEIPSWLLECGSSDGERDELQLSTLDLTQATWAMPAGFQRASGYVEDNPVETLHSIWVAEPTDPPLPSLNVVNVVLYTDVDWGDLADGCGRVPLAAVEEKLARYRDQIGASPMGEATMTEVSGLPAVTQEVGLASYDYVGYWLFSSDQLLHVYCQWTSDSYRATITSGCDELVASVQVPGA